MRIGCYILAVSMLASAVGCARSYVTLPHDSLEPCDFVTLSCECSGTSIGVGDTLVVRATLTNTSSQRLRLNPLLRFGLRQYRFRLSPEDSLAEALDRARPRYSSHHCRSSEVAIQLPEISPEELFGCCWTVLEPGAAIVDTLYYPPLLRLGVPYPSDSVWVPSVIFRTPAQELDLPRIERHCEFPADSTRVTVR